jgi:hypothetical protein
MFGFPQVVSLPFLSGVAADSVQWPWIGAFLAWVLIAALVGTSLGFLRDYLRNASEQRGVGATKAEPLRLLTKDAHREAA